MPNFIGVAVDERVGVRERAPVSACSAWRRRARCSVARSTTSCTPTTASARARRCRRRASAGGPVPFFEVRLRARATEPSSTSRSGSRRSACAAEDAVLIHGRDHSRRRSAERALQESEALYRRLAENSSDIISEYDAEWRLLYVSPSIERVLGYPQNTWVGRRARRDVRRDDPPGRPRPASSRSRASSTNRPAPPRSSPIARARPTAAGAGCTRAAGATWRTARSASSWSRAT